MTIQELIQNLSRFNPEDSIRFYCNGKEYNIDQIKDRGYAKDNGVIQYDVEVEIMLDNPA